MMPGYEDGYLDVPIDYAHPDDGMVAAVHVERLADDPDARVGSLLVPGSGFAYYDAARVLDDEVLEAFDIIGFDQRGTGGATPAIDCVDDLDHFYAGTDITPDDDAERQQIIDLAEEFADACVANNAEIIQFVGTNNGRVTSIRSARRSARTRSATTATTAKAMDPSLAGCGRRCSRPPCGPPCSTRRQIPTTTRTGRSCKPRASRTSLGGISPSAAPILSVPSTTTATPKEPSTS